MTKQIIIFLGLLTSGVSHTYAQQTEVVGEPSDGTSSIVTVDATSPILYECGNRGNNTCFRMYFEVTPVKNIAIRMASIEIYAGSLGIILYQTQGFSSTGASCVARSMGGIPSVYYGHNGPEWKREQPFIALPSKPATLLLQFACDGRLIPGDEVTIQMTLALDPSDRRIEIGRYLFRKLKLKHQR